MRKVVEGSYPTLNDALLAVERLRDAGHAKEEIVLVANEEKRSEIIGRSQVQLEDVDALDAGADTESRSLWDRVREAFSVDNYHPDVYTREGEGEDADPLHSYREEVAKGNILVLLHEKDQERQTNDRDATENRMNSSSGTSAGKRASDYAGVDSQTPRTINSTGETLHGSETNTLADPEKSLDVDVEGMKQEYEQQREWGEKSLREDREDRP